ncbi:MAG: DHHW family protein [Oscillospiraceae bacterium]
MQFKMTPNKLMIGLFAVILLAVPITTAALPKQKRSENENRTLAEFPKLVNSKKLEKAENLGDVIDAVRWDYIAERKKNSYMDDIEKYFTDHLAGRETWVVAKNTMEKLVGKQEINGVYTVDDRMIQSLKEYDPEVVSASIAAMNGFAAKHPDIPAAFMLAPTSQELYSTTLPSYAGLVNEKAFIDECYKQAENMQTIDCLSYLTGHTDEYIYYRTDHHWTSLGAYYAYCSAAGKLGYSSYPLSAFNIETASSSFRGTLFSRTLDKGVTPDSIEYFHLKNGEPSIKMTVFDGSEETVYDSLYVREFLEVKDKYSSFTGSNAPLVTIETDVDNGKSLLLIKDSYAHSLVPFLSKHYSKITMVDMRYINVGLDYFLNVDDYSQIMFMYNAVSFSSDEHIKKLKLSK